MCIARFDWYGATVEAHAPVVLDLLMGAFGPMEETKAVNGFTDARRCPSRNISIHWGGHNPHPFILASGQDAPDGAAFVREKFALFHRVARADICLDFLAQPGAFDTLEGILTPIARAAGVAVLFVGDPDPNKGRGRTIYYGSKDSDVRLVLYEKGVEQAAKGVPDADPFWARVELRAKPRKQRKAVAARLDPLAFFGFSRWTTKALEEITGALVPAVPDLSLRLSRDEQALDHLTKQYGRLLWRVIEKGGPDGMRDELMRRLLRDRERKDRRGSCR